MSVEVADRTTGTDDTESSGSPKLLLGTTEYTVVAQPYPRIFRQLSEFGEELQALGEVKPVDAGALVAVLGERAHAFLKIFIPNLMAEHQFAGFATRAAMEIGEPDEQAEAEAPTLPQIIEAVETAVEVNGGKRLTGMVGKLLGPKLKDKLQAYAAAKVSEALRRDLTNSPSPSDGATPDGSTPVSPTPASGGVESRPTEEDEQIAEMVHSSSSTPGLASAGSPSLVSSP